MTAPDPNTYRWLVHDVSERRPAHAFRDGNPTAMCWCTSRQPMTRWRAYDGGRRDWQCGNCLRAVKRANKRRADERQPPLREVTEL